MIVRNSMAPDAPTPARIATEPAHQSRLVVRGGSNRVNRRVSVGPGKAGRRSNSPCAIARRTNVARDDAGRRDTRGLAARTTKAQAAVVLSAAPNGVDRPDRGSRRAVAPIAGTL